MGNGFLKAKSLLETIPNLAEEPPFEFSEINFCIIKWI